MTLDPSVESFGRQPLGLGSRLVNLDLLLLGATADNGWLMPDASVGAIPWVIWNVIVDTVRRAYPEEGCGLIFSKDNILVRITPIENIATRLHAEDKMRSPRHARNGYFMDPAAQILAFREARERGEELAIIFHSHPDADAYLSEEDQRVALFDGEPAYPGVLYLVVSVTGGTPGEARLYSWDAASGSFVGTTVTVYTSAASVV